MIKKFRTMLFKVLDILVIMTMISASPMSISATAMAQDTAPTLAVDKSDYAPGEAVHVTGSGFTPGDYVLTTSGPDGPADWGTITADETGSFATDSPTLGSVGTYELSAAAMNDGTVAASVGFTVTAPPPPATEVPTETPTEAVPTEVPTEAPTEVVPSDTPAPTETETPAPAPILPPTIESGQADYPQGGFVTLTGANWQGDTEVRIIVNDDIGQTWKRDVIVTVAADGTISDSFNLPSFFVATFNVVATGQQTSRAATTSFTDAPKITAKTHQGQLNPSGSYTSGNITTYQEGDFINFRFTLTATEASSGQLQVRFTGNDGTCLFFNGTFTLGTYDSSAAAIVPVSGATPTVTPSGTPVATAFGTSSGEWVQTLNITFSAAGEAVVNYYLQLSDQAGECNGSSQHSRLSPGGGDVGQSGQQNVPVPANQIIELPEITVTKKIDRDGNGTFESTAAAGEYCFTLDGGACISTNGSGQVTFINVTPDGNHSITETQLDFTQGTYGFASGSGTNCTFSGSTATATVASGTTATDATCTFNNALQQGTLTVIKHVVTDNGGTATASQWSIHVKSGANEVTGSPQSGSESGTVYTLAAGSYTVSETDGPTGYSFTGFTGDCDNSGNVTVVAGQNKTCTLTNDDVAPQLKLVKTVTTDNGGTASANDWDLTATGTGGFTELTPAAADATFHNVVAGVNYALSETGPTGYTAGNFTCNGGTQSGNNIQLSEGQSVTCTINNDDVAPQLKLVKTVTTDDGGTAVANDWDLTATGTGGFTELTPAAADATFHNVVAGVNYALSETGPTGYSAGNFVCDGGTQAGNNIQLSVNQTVTCTINNDDQPGTLIVKKVVINDNGGTKIATEFSFQVNGGNSVAFLQDTDTFHGKNTLTVDAGSYSVTEPAVAGYTTSYNNCSNVVVANGATQTCTITNDDQAGTLTVNKVVVPNSDTGLFDLQIDGTSYATGVGDGGTTGAVTVNAGSHTVGEVAGTGTDLANYDTVISGDCAPNGTVTLALGESKTCTITNTRHGTIIVVKQTNPDGAAGSFQFTGDASGTISDNGSIVVSNLSPGTYTSTEIVTSGWELTGIVCDDSNSTGNVNLTTATFHVEAGETVTCTFTNATVSISITKTADASPVSAGDTIGFVITVTNTGAGTAQSVTVNDTLPTDAGLNWSIDAGNSDTGCSIASGVLTCNFGNMPGGTSKHVHITSPTTAATCSTVENTASVATNNDGSGQAGDSVAVNCPNLAISKVADAGTVNAGDSIGFTITVVNNGLGTAKNVTLSDTLPTGSGISWTINPAVQGCSIAAGVLTCSFGNLAPGASASVHLTSPTTASSCATYNNTATAQADNNPQIQGSASIIVNCAQISVTKIADDGTVSAGEAIGFTITVTNTGAGAAYNVSLSDTLPTNSGLSWSIDGGTGAAQCSISAGVLTCNFGTLAAGASQTVHISSPTTAATCGTVENTASVTTSNDGSGQAGDAVTVQCPSLSVVKTADAASVSAGDTIGFTITVTNAGPGEAKSVTLTDTLPGGLAWAVDAVNTTATGCSITSGVLTCGPQTLASGTSIQVHVTAVTTAAVCGALTNSATATPTNGTGATSQSATITVNCPNVTVLKTADNSPINAGDTGSFTIVVSNTGAGTARNVTLTDTLPAGITWSVGGTDAAACSINAGVLTCNFGDLASGGSKTITVSGQTTATNCGVLNNLATVAATNEAAGDQGNNSSSATITVNCPNVTVQKTANSGTINAGDVATFTIVVSNTGTGTAYNVALSDTLPAGVTWSVGGPNGADCSITAGVLTCNFGNLAAGATRTVTVSGQTDAADCGILSNTATVAASNEAAEAQADNSSTASITTNCPDVTVLKTADSGTINAGDTASFTIVVNNAGAGTAYNVTLTDTLPAGVTWTIDPAVTGCNIAGGMLSCSWTSLAAGASITIHISGVTSAAACGTLNNTATVAASNEANTANNSSSASITVNCSDLTVTKEAVSGTINAGDTAAFKITVTNTGLGTAYNVTLTDTLPAGVTWAIDPSVTGCNIAGGVLSCSWATLAPGAAIEINVSGTTDAADCGTLSNTATVAASNESNTANNSSTATITTNCPDLTVSKAAASGTINAGDVASFTILVSNTGAGTAYGVTLTDTVPAGIVWSLSGLDAGDCSITAGVLTCDFGDLANGESRTVTVSGTTSAAECGVVSNMATVAATNEAAGDTGNNTSTATITVNCPNVTVAKTADNSPINAGDTASFTIVVSNTGAGTAYGVTLSDTLPTGVTWSEDSADCSIAGGVLSCSFGNLASGATRTIHVSGVTTAAECGVLSNTATVAATNEAADDTGDNTSTATITVNCPDVTVTKTADSGTINAGATASFTIVVSNTGAGTAYGVTLSDTLPAGITWSENSADCSITAGVLSCNFDDLASGASRTVTVSGLTAAVNCGTITNTATVGAANEAADDQTNNSSTATIAIKCGTLTINKTAVGSDGTFNYTGAGTDVPPNFSITTSGGTGSQTFANIAPGSKAVTELGPSTGWDFTSLVCTDPDNGTTVNGQTANIDLDGDETVTCTFTNTKRGHIIIDKVTVPSGDPQSFSFDAQGGSYADFNLTDAAAPNDQELPPGTYSVTEGALTGWDLTGLSCSDPGNDTTVTGNKATINLAAGETVTCTFTNTKRGSIKIIKDAVPNDAQDFAFTTTGIGLSSFSLDDDSNATLPNNKIVTNLVPGAYSVTEGAVAGWDLTGLTCNDANGTIDLGTLTTNIGLDPGENVICTFTNTKRGTIIVEKQTNPNGAPGLFTFTGTAAGAIADNGTITVANLVPGTYTSTEADPAASLFKLTSIVCNDGTSANPSTGNVTTRTATFKLDPGETVRCVFTNTKDFHPGTIGFWKNWRNHYTSTQFQLLINYLKVNNPKIYNKDLAIGTSDDLNIAKVDAIFNVGSSTPRDQMILAQFTALKFNLAITQLQGTSGLVQKNNNICTAGVIDVSGISGATAFFGTSTPTIQQVVDAIEGRWTGTLTTNRNNWKFNFANNAQRDMIIKVLTGINEGTIVMSSGCP